MVMEVRAKFEGSTTLDSALTLIDTISYRLELLSHDYRGLDDLKLELNLLHKLLLRARFLRSNPYSIFLTFSEELRHFYFLLRSEHKLLYVLVEEIARFRERVKSFREQFCEWNTCTLDAVLDKLQPLVPLHPRGDHGYLIELKVDLKLIKLFYRCAINWRNQASHEFSLYKVKCGINEEATQFYYRINHELAEAFSSFRGSLLKCCKQQIFELYTIMSDSFLQSHTSPWLCCQLNEFFDSLLDSLGDIINWGKACDPRIYQLIEPIQNMMKFLKFFIRFVTLGVETPWMFERFFIHCQVSAIDAASLGYKCWFYRDDEQVFYDVQLKSSELVEKIKPVNDLVTQNYIETLITSRRYRSSVFPIEASDTHIAGDFVHYLLDNLYEFLSGNTSILVSLDLQMKMIAIGLSCCRIILMGQKNDDDLHQGELDVVLDVVYEAAILIFQLLRRKERLDKEMVVSC